MDRSFFFLYCQKLVVFNNDFSEILLAKRQGEQDYDGIFSFIGGKMETSDGGFVESLRREKNEEIGKVAQVAVLPTITNNVYFKRKDNNHMVLPHYAARYDGDDIEINQEYSEYRWVKLDELENFEPKIENISAMVTWAKNVAKQAKPEDWVLL